MKVATATLLEEIEIFNCSSILFIGGKVSPQLIESVVIPMIQETNNIL
tara:strand:- start:185 stop:328 length:144 start_codon:yes stop_codon:yes gene_type:complete